MKKCSVVIPVYNCPPEQLRRCLDCFVGVNQDIEILVIDDGSANSCHTVVEERAVSNTSIRLIRQTNMGVSGARNRGVEEASGRYIVFCDADDKVDPGNLMKLLAEADGGDFDFVVADYMKVNGDGSFVVRMDDIGSSDELLETFLCAPNLYGTVWAKMFRTEFIRSHGIIFNRELKHGEDSIFILDCLTNNPRVMVSHDPFYTYIVNKSSAAKSDSGAIDNFLTMLQFGKDRIDEVCPSYRAEYALFCNINLLIMLVGFIFPSCVSYHDGKPVLKRVLGTEIIRGSLSSYAKNKTGMKNRVAIMCLKHKWYYACYLLAGVRNR